MRCEACNHLYADAFPEKLFLYEGGKPADINTHLLFMYSQTLANIRRYTAGMKLLEVGVGNCECILAAREIGYDVFGMDVVESVANYAKGKFSLNVECLDFVEFETAEQWDVIMMGDVIEHVSDPCRAIEKAAALLTKGGALWISTPNFESAFATVDGHNDAMRKEAFHVNYFSRDSLYTLLDRYGLVPVEYQISGHYNGSMEVVAMKAEDIQTS